MQKTLSFITILSTIAVTIMFLGSDPSSARGFYYIIWLSFGYILWRKRDSISEILRRLTSPRWVTFIGLGILMIALEETIAGLTVNILKGYDFVSLISSVIPYYQTNLIILPGYIIAWYILLKYFRYSQIEFFILVGLFGIYAEKTLHHVFTLPIIGIPLLVLNFFTYIVIILPSYLSLGNPRITQLHPILRYGLGFFFPILVSIPLVLLLQYLNTLGYIDSSLVGK